MPPTTLVLLVQKQRQKLGLVQMLKLELELALAHNHGAEPRRTPKRDPELAFQRPVLLYQRSHSSCSNVLVHTMSNSHQSISSAGIHQYAVIDLVDDRGD